MTKRQKKNKPPTRVNEGASLEAASIPINLDRIGLRSLQYIEKPTTGPVQQLTLGTRMDIQLRMEMRVQIFAEGFELFLEADAVPDPSYLPIEVKAGISAFFSPRTAMTQEQIVSFVGGAGVRMLFPYLREIISTTSMRGMFGPLWLDPMSINVVNLEQAPAQE